MTRRAALLLTLVISLLIAAYSADYFFRNPMYETGDSAANSLAVDRAKHFAELYGAYSRWGFHHPGPALFYVQALGEWLFFDTLGIVPAPYNGQALICLFVEVGFFVAALQVFTQWLPSRGRWWFLPLALALAALQFGNPAPGRGNVLPADAAFQSMWAPGAVILAFLSLLAASASVAAGRGQELPLLVLAGGFLVHSHVAQPLFVVPCALLAYAGLIGAYLARPEAQSPPACPWWRRISHRAAAPWRHHRRAHVVAGCLLCLFLLPLVVDLARGSQSNFAAILRHLHEYPARHKSLFRSFFYFLQYGAFATYQAGGSGQDYFGHYNSAGLWRYWRENAPILIVWAAAFALSAGAAIRPLWALARRRRPLDDTARFLAWAGVFLFLAAALTLRWGVIQDGDMYYYNAWFNFAIYFFAALIAAAWILCAGLALIERLGVGGFGLVELGVVMLATIACLTVLAARLKIVNGWWIIHLAMHDRVAPVIADATAAHTVKFLDFPELTWPYAMAVALQLDRARQPFVVPTTWATMFGAEHTQKTALEDLAAAHFQKWSFIEPANTKTAENASRKLVALEEGISLTVDPPSILQVDHGGVAVLDFRSSAAPADFGISGWFGAEPWGEWTAGRRSVLTFRAAPTGADVQLILDVFPFLSPARGLSVQRLRVSFNGERIGPEFRLEHGDQPPIELTIPQALWNRVAASPAANAVLELDHPDAASPLSLDPSKTLDERVLALGVRRIVFHGLAAGQAAALPGPAEQPARNGAASAAVPSEYVFNGQTEPPPAWAGISRDGWAGKHATISLPIDGAGEAAFLRLEGVAPQRAGITYPYRFTIQVDQAPRMESVIKEPGSFDILAPLQTPANTARQTAVQLDFPQTFIPARTEPGSRDDRELSLLLHAVRVTTAAHPLFAFFRGGWYDLETDHGNWWRWSAEQSVVELAAARPGILVIGGAAGTLEPGNGLDILLDGQPIATLPMPTIGWGDFTARAPITAGEHTLTFRSLLPGVKAAGETRVIAFGIRDAQFKLEER